MPSPKPAVIIRREFEATPEVVTQQLRACIIGPACQLVRFAKAEEKSRGFIEAVQLTTDTFDGTSKVSDMKLYADSSAGRKSFPSSLANTSVVDANSVRLFMEDALLTYADIGNAGPLAAAHNFCPVDTGNFTNVVRFDSNKLTEGSTLPAWRGVDRHSSLLQNVEIGDIVQLYTVSDTNASLIKTTKVIGFANEIAPTGEPASLLAGNTAYFELQNDGTGGDSTPPAPPDKIIVGGCSFIVDVSDAYNTAANYLVDPRRTGFTARQYTLTVTSYNSKDGSITISIGNNGPQVEVVNSHEFKVGEVNPLVLPSGIEISLDPDFDPDAGKVNTGATGTFVYGPVHKSYDYAAVPSSGKITVGIIDQSAFTQLVPNNSFLNIRCSEGGHVSGTVPVKFTWAVSGTNLQGSFDVVSLDSNESKTYTISNIGVAITIHAHVWSAATARDSGFISNDMVILKVIHTSNSGEGGVAVDNASPTNILNALLLADPYSAANVVRVRLSKLKTVEIPRFKLANNGLAASPNWTLSDIGDKDARRIAIEPKVTLTDSSVVNAASLTGGKLYVEFRSFLELPREIGSVTTLSDISSQLGVIDPENSLAYAVFKAFTNANGAIVHFIPTVSDSLNGYRGYADALSLAAGERNCYSLVPLTSDPEVWNAAVAHVNDESAPDSGRYRILWIAPEISSIFKIQDSFEASVTAGNAPLTFNISPADINFDSKFTETLNVGDRIRRVKGNDIYGKPVFGEYRIVAVNNNRSFTVVVPESDSIPNAASIEIYRPLTSAATAQKYVEVAGGFSSERVFAVVPNRGINGLKSGGRSVKNYNVAAAFAGLRSGSRPHQPLSNVELLGFDGLNSNVPAFNGVDLDTLRDGGIWVVMQNEEGKIFVERQLSTSTIDIFRKEQSVTCNIDSIAFSLGDGLKNLVGRVNITDGNVSLVRANLVAILTSFMNATGSETIGSQLNSYAIEEIFIPTTAQDTIKAKIAVSVPLPMNIIDITIVV